MNTCLYSKCFFIYCKQEKMKRLFLTMLLFFFAFAFAWCDSANVKECKKMISEWLKSPSTAEFIDVHDVQSDVISWMFVKWSVDSQNWFWATVRTNFYCATVNWNILSIPEWSEWFTYEFLQEIEKQWTWINYWDFRLQKLFEWTNDKFEACEQFVKVALWVDIVYWLEQRKVENFEWLFWKSSSIWADELPIDFYVYKNWWKKDWYCMLENTLETAKVSHWVFWINFDWNSITLLDI